MRSHPAGEGSCIIDEVLDSPSGVVMMNTGFGGGRIVALLVGEQLPRNC
jgi:hydrogenase expression/formation protein HypE